MAGRDKHNSPGAWVANSLAGTFDRPQATASAE